jgi:septal ring factor EnvC (AmiA/AmiB activator)
MEGEILLVAESSDQETQEEIRPLKKLEEKISYLLSRYDVILRERDELSAALRAEREKASRLEKKLQLLSQDRESVKTRIDQLLHRLKGIDL